MNIINLKSIKGLNVYKSETMHPWGIVRNISLNRISGKIDTLLIDTISLIPLSHIIDIHNIYQIKNNSIYLKNPCYNISEKCPDYLSELKIGERIILPNNNLTRLRDLHFDTETGEITDIVVSQNKLAKKNKIPINKIYIKDNTIYVD